MQLPVGLAAGGGGVFFMAVVAGWYGMPKLISSQIASGLALKKGSDIRQMWSNFSDPIDFRVYVLNLTNPEAVHRGEKPIVQEIGPYFYEEYKQKVKLRDHKEDDTVSYNNKITWLFNQGKSAPGLTGDELVTMPHPLLLGLLLTLERDKPGMLALVNKAIPPLFRKPESIFVTAPVRNFLFDGIVINCTVTDFSAKALCTGLKKEAKELKREGDNFFFSFFGHKNGTVDAGRLRVKRGIQNIDDLGRVVAFNGEPKMSSWRGDPCNDLRGTDSTIFPPFRDPKEPIVAFGADLCLSLGANWERKAEYMGVPGNRYTAELPDMKGNAEHHCYCPTEQTCLEKGTLDLSPCAGAPVIATLPHFYLASETYLQTVSGLQPTKENHELFMVFESTTGSPMEARKRLQFNMFLHKINKIDLLANVPYALMPLIWVEEGLALEEKYVSTLRMLFRMQGIMSGVKWTLMAVGMGMAGAGGYLHFKRRKELVVGPAEPKKVVAGHDTTGHPIRLESSHSRY
ncbi:sensory neuron membrane protein 1-like [Schistocerca nitens]|uniref:sensory neuron membrane protein 1-like n=1 Tax=Schistocerca nitens TaxID=7011 RepID=UPI00211819AD|nr:sensory neuron membrane protein 1-like [Schistocerca nitens]